MPRKVRQATLDITRRRVRHSRVERAVVTLSINQVAFALAPKLVGKNTNRVPNGSIAVRMVLHRVAHDVGNLCVASVILLPKRVHNAPLNGLKAVLHSWNRARTDYIRRILTEVIVIEVTQGSTPREPFLHRHRHAFYFLRRRFFFRLFLLRFFICEREEVKALI